MTRIPASKEIESREAPYADTKDFLDPSDSCDFGYMIVRAPQRSESVGAKERSE